MCKCTKSKIDGTVFFWLQEFILMGSSKDSVYGPWELFILEEVFKQNMISKRKCSVLFVLANKHSTNLGCVPY